MVRTEARREARFLTDRPSRSKEQIFYGKTGSSLATYEHQMPYHVKKQGDL
jgi:hypothetical protein